MLIEIRSKPPFLDVRTPPLPMACCFDIVHIDDADWRYLLRFRGIAGTPAGYPFRQTRYVFNPAAGREMLAMATPHDSKDGR